jgi:hypothetical protein
MASGLSLTEQFLVLFNALKVAAGNNPERVRVFYTQSEAIRDALRALNAFLEGTDLERRVFHGRKTVVPRATGFEVAWNEYDSKWRFRVNEPADDSLALLDEEVVKPEADPDNVAALRERLWREAQVEPETSARELTYESPILSTRIPSIRSYTMGLRPSGLGSRSSSFTPIMPFTPMTSWIAQKGIPPYSRSGPMITSLIQ